MTRARWVVTVVTVVVAAATAVAVWRLSGDTGDSAERTVPVAAVVADGRTLRVTFLAGAAGCGAPAGVAVEETATAVRLLARVRYEARDEGVVCPLVGRRVTEAVTLSTPLGQRTVIDGKTGRPVPVASPSPAPGA